MTKNVMVCVTQQKTCDRLIRYGHQLLGESKGELFIIHVAHYQFKFLGSSKEGEALEYLFEVSKKAGADLTVIRSKDVIKAISDFALKNDITHIIMGSSPNGEKIENNSIALVLKKMLPKAKFIII